MLLNILIIPFIDELIELEHVLSTFQNTIGADMKTKAANNYL